jgi:hypothetical protein
LQRWLKSSAEKQTIPAREVFFRFEEAFAVVRHDAHERDARATEIPSVLFRST